MRRNRRQEEPENPDRWVVSYADFITLLFALFTTLYAISHVDLGKLERFAGSMKNAFGTKSNDLVDTTVISGIRPANYADVSLEKELRDEVKKFGIIEGITIMRDERGVVVSLGETLLFETGTADIRKTARPFLSIVASFIRKTRRSIVIEGHTDNIPLRNARYASNIELSAARAANTYAVLLNEEAGGPDLLSTAGYGEFRPIASNATFEGRIRNRRVDIIFVTRKEGA